MAKQEQARNMFNRIAGDYDFLNHLLSFRIDKLWRRKAIRCLEERHKEYVLDMACGTADFSMEAVHAGVKQVLGMDISEEMLKIGQEKVRKAGLEGRIHFRQGACEALDLEDEVFSGATVAFGVRNFEDRDKGLRELYRVLKPGGRLIVLEFSLPRNPLFRAVYLFYFNKILPFVGGLVSGNRKAYAYLPESVKDFPPPKDFCKSLQDAGFGKVGGTSLSLGIVFLYVADKSGGENDGFVKQEALG